MGFVCSDGVDLRRSTSLNRWLNRWCITITLCVLVSCGLARLSAQDLPVADAADAADAAVEQSSPAKTPNDAPPNVAPPAAQAAKPSDVNPKQPSAGAPVKDGELRFAFDGARWRDVIKWLADEAELALHVGDLPTGSFTYSDPRSFTLQGAIDRVNLFLLPQGFTLVRNGKLLSVIDLGDTRAMQQLDALARVVTVEQLDTLEDHEVAKCIFPLGELKAEDAVEELSAFKLMMAPAVFSKTNRLMITDTAGKLKIVKAILSAFEPAALDNGTLVKSFSLKHVDAEDVLLVARPHLGLATGEMIGIDVSLSADLPGKNIFVTGIADKVKMIEGLIEAIDKPREEVAGKGTAVLRSHAVEGGNVEMVYNVLQTLLADESIRLSMDETAGSIVALATPEVQTEIEQTVAQLAATVPDFEIIPLKNVDPRFVVTLLEQMLDLPDPFYDDPEDIDPDAPKIDADPDNMRLFVRAKRAQIEQIKKIVSGLDVSSNVNRGGKLRIFPLKGRHAERVLETAAKFWRAPNPIILFQATNAVEAEETERVVADVSSETPLAEPRRTDATTPEARLLTDGVSSQAPAIRCELTSRGLLLQSDDTAALDQFEEHLRTIAGPANSLPSPPVVFYLKYARPDDAIRVLAELLDGGESVQESSSGSLVNGYVGSSGSYLTSIVTSRAGTTTMLSGTITVVADSRLNRLIAQGTADDIERIESYLKIIDKDGSITAVETYGTSHVIEVKHMRASELAAVIREAYADRVIAASSGARQPNQAQPNQGSKPKLPASPQASKGGEEEAKPTSGRPQPDSRQATPQASNQPVRSLEPKMTIAVHESSNSLIVTAPEALFREVEQLAKLMDARSEQAVQVLSVSNSAALDLILMQSISEGGRTSSPRSEPRTAAPSRSPGVQFSPRPPLQPAQNKSNR